MKPGHAMLHLGIGEQPFNAAPQPHRSLEKAGSHLGPCEVARVFILHAAQRAVASARALLAQGTCLAVVRSSGVSMHSGRPVKTAVREHVPCQAGVAVTIAMVVERFTRELALGLLGALDHRNVGQRPLIAYEGKERGAAISLVSGDPSGSVIEPIGCPRQHIASRVHLVREAGGGCFDIEGDSTWSIDQDIQGIAEPPPDGASRPSRGRIRSRYTGNPLVVPGSGTGALARSASHSRTGRVAQLTSGRLTGSTLHCQLASAVMNEASIAASLPVTSPFAMQRRTVFSNSKRNTLALRKRPCRFLLKVE